MKISIPEHLKSTLVTGRFVLIAFAIIFYIVGLLILAAGIAVYKGKTGLIHYYHRKNIVDHIGYGRAIGKPLVVMGMSGIVCATLSFIGELWMTVGIAVFFIGIISMLIVCLIITKKYNGKVFYF